MTFIGQVRTNSKAITGFISNYTFFIGLVKLGKKMLFTENFISPSKLLLLWNFYSTWKEQRFEILTYCTDIYTQSQTYIHRNLTVPWKSYIILDQ